MIDKKIVFRELKKRKCLLKPVTMPEKLNDFSDFQMKNFLDKSCVTQKIEDVRKDMNRDGLGILGLANVDGAIMRKIASEDSSYMVYVKNLPKTGQNNIESWMDFETSEDLISVKVNNEDQAGAPLKLSSDEPKLTQIGLNEKPNTYEDINTNSAVLKAEFNINEVMSRLKMPIKEIKINHLDEEIEINKNNVIENKMKNNEMKTNKECENSQPFTNIDSYDSGISTQSEPSSQIPLETQSDIESSSEDEFEDVEVLAGMASITDNQNNLSSKNQKSNESDSISDVVVVSDDEIDVPEASTRLKEIATGTLEQQQSTNINIRHMPETKNDVTINPINEFEHNFLVDEVKQTVNKNTYQLEDYFQDDDKNVQVSSTYQAPSLVLPWNSQEVISLEQEELRLVRELEKEENRATTVTELMYEQCQKLLKLFGLPFIVSPGEAEAQCAYLDSIGLVHGSITDDSDVWLFGGKTVYKNFFEREKFVEKFTMAEIEGRLMINRSNLICLAMMLGSDYCDGIENIGPVHGMEVLEEFGREFGIKVSIKCSCLSELIINILAISKGIAIGY